MPLCLVLLGVSACTNDSDEPLEYSSDPLLNGADIGAADLTGVEFLGDLAVVSTTDFTGGRLSVIDLTTGRTRWSAADGDPILGGDSSVVDLRSPHEPTKPVIRDRGKGDFDVYVPYRTTERIDAPESEDATGVGIAALAGENGRAQWMSERFLTAEGERGDLKTRPVLAEGDTVVASAGHPKNGGSPITFVIDADTGDTRWTKTNVWPTALGEKAVVVEASSSPELLLAEQGPDRRDGTTPSGLSVDDGQPIWDLDDEFAEVTTGAVDGAHSIVTGEKKSTGGSSGQFSDHGTVVISNDTGDVVEELEIAPSCRASSTMIACSDGDKLITIGSDADEVETTTPYGTGSGASDWDLLDVFDETILVKDETDDNDRIQALDAEGKVRSEDLPATPSAMSENYLTVCDEARKDCRFHAADPDAAIDRPTSATASPLTLSDPLPSSVPERSVPPGTELDDVRGVTLVDDALVLNGDSIEDNRPVLAVSDAESGKLRWSLDTSAVSGASGASVTPLFRTFGNPRALDTAEGFFVLVGATSAGSTGIAAFDGKDGDFESFHRLGDSGGPGNTDEAGGSGEAGETGPVVDAVDADGTQAAIDVDDDGHHETTLVDFSSPAKPKSKWTKGGVEPVRLGEESVLVRHVDGRGDDRELTGVELLSLDDPDDVIWRSRDVREDEYPEEVMYEAGMLIVNWSDGAEIIDATDGKSLGAIGKRLSECVAAGDSIMCSTARDAALRRLDPPVVLTRTESGLDISELSNHAVAGVSGGHDGRFFVDEAAGPVGIDSNGLTVDSGFTGRFRNASEDDFALFMTCVGSACESMPSWDVRRIG